MTLPATEPERLPRRLSAPLRRLTPDAARRLILANLVAQVGIVVTGGLVRLTGSGLGCPTWPQCVPGSYTPVVHQAEGYHKNVEFGNRTLTFVVLLTAIGAALATWSLLRRSSASGRRRTLALGLTPLAGVVAQAVLGGITVLAGLSPVTVAAHFLLSMVLVAASTALLYRAGALVVPGAGAEVTLRREVRGLALALAVVTVPVLVLGTVVTGSGPHSGDPASPRFGLDPRAVSWLHADAVWVFLALLAALAVAVKLTAPGSPLWRRVLALGAVTAVQAGIGFLQYATSLPIALVAAHLLGASLLVVAVTAVVVGTRSWFGVAVPD